MKCGRGALQSQNGPFTMLRMVPLPMELRSTGRTRATSTLQL
ncbi:MAG: hypothetical protein QOG84_2860 [Sphingomonadales bacterium]|jgi:hypothetical protein|nr:hypothetical protein [Sphingomonadales bacterium]